MTDWTAEKEQQLAQLWEEKQRAFSDIYTLQLRQLLWHCVRNDADIEFTLHKVIEHAHEFRQALEPFDREGK